ncbi:hypothetical protein M1O19_06490 [Dehalococcoidia bacterium]|nr:hypothetical protein [Dehalococcoidia bacterium]
MQNPQHMSLKNGKPVMQGISQYLAAACSERERAN